MALVAVWRVWLSEDRFMNAALPSLPTKRVGWSAVGLSYLLGFGSEQPGHGSMEASRSFANGGRVDVAWQGPCRWVGGRGALSMGGRGGKGRGKGGVLGGMVGVCGIGRRRVAGGVDGLSRDLQQGDCHRTRLAKPPSLMAHAHSFLVAKVGGRRVTRRRRKPEGGRSSRRDFWRPPRMPTRRPFCRKGGIGISGAMAKKRKKKQEQARCPPCR